MNVELNDSACGFLRIVRPKFACGPVAVKRGGFGQYLLKGNLMARGRVRRFGRSSPPVVCDCDCQAGKHAGRQMSFGGFHSFEPLTAQQTNRQNGQKTDRRTGDRDKTGQVNKLVVVVCSSISIYTCRLPWRSLSLLNLRPPNFLHSSSRPRLALAVFVLELPAFRLLPAAHRRPPPPPPPPLCPRAQLPARRSAPRHD